MFAVVLLFGCLSVCAQKDLRQVKSFGSNPGNLKMYLHTPPGSDAKTKMPLVVVLHGCTQNASVVANQNGFRVLYPQQRMVNNPMRCFCI